MAKKDKTQQTEHGEKRQEMNSKLANLREDYQLQTLDLGDVSADPTIQFQKWFDEACAAQILEPNAFVLASVSAEGKPSARVVLLKGFDSEGFVFFTNYLSRKSWNMFENPEVAVVFNWLDLQRQVRIEGRVEKIDAASSDAYFKSRPMSSQIGAWVSPQSQVVPNRLFLEEKLQNLNEKWLDSTDNAKGNLSLERPAHWGGFRIRPDSLEFWQGRSSRLHDRIAYNKTSNGAWKIERLAP
jgi:pyridoxamine 5'-phosphate oxidase